MSRLGHFIYTSATGLASGLANFFCPKGGEREREPSASFLCSCRREKQWAADQRRLKGKAKFARSNQSPFHPLSLSLSLSLAAALSDFLTTAFSQ